MLADYSVWLKDRQHLARPDTLKDIYIIKLFAKNIISLLPYFLRFSINLLSNTLLFLNDRWFILAAPHARAPVIIPLVNWHLRMCHNHRSHSTMHHITHLRKRSIL
jgi:hypothetical protein